MKYVTLYLTTITTLVCCNNKKEQSILLFNEISFKLNAGEEVSKIDLKNREIFTSYFDKKSIQIPLFRYIKSDKYAIFIGIPFNTSITELSNSTLSRTLNQTFFEGDSTNYFIKNYNNEKEQITIYTRNFSNNLVYILTVSNSAELSDSLFNSKQFSKRFN